LVTFRASGRLFWPVFYVGLFASIALVSRRLSARAASGVMVAAVVLQALDMRGFYDVKSRDFRLTMAEPLPSEFWKLALPTYRHVVLYPSNICPASEPGLDYRFFALHAGRAGATINGGFAARYDAQALGEYCAAFERDMRAGRVSDDSLYVLSRAAVPLMRAAGAQVACVPVDGVHACFTARSHDAWATAFRANSLWLAPLADFQRFRDALEAEYRDRLRRSTVNLPGTAGVRTSAVVRYLGYRVGGCSEYEALDHVLAERAGRPGGRLCRGQLLAGGPLPPATELQRVYASLGESGVIWSPASVDAEEEMVWIHAYARERMSGKSDEEATAAVLTAIGSTTRSPPAS
jgi:hypothetical protein